MGGRGVLRWNECLEVLHVTQQLDSKILFAENELVC